MQKIIILAETGSDISPERARKYGIRLVPMHVSFGDVTKDDGSFPPEEVCEYYQKTGKVPKTSGCNPEDFMKVFDEIHQEDPEAKILYLAYSSVTTCAFQSAALAAEDRDYVLAIDTKHVSMWQCAAVLKAARMIRQHPEWTLEEAGKAAREAAKSTRMCFIPSNLDYLRAGGRVSNATALCGNILNIHPCIELLDGYLKATKKYRGKLTRVIPKLIKEYSEANQLDKEEIWFGCTPGFTRDLMELAETCAVEQGFRKIHWIHAGGVITSHGGPSAFSVTGYVKA